MPKFYVSKESVISSDRIVLAGDDVAHITKVLRKGIGDTIEVFDGEGTDYIVEIDSVDKRQITGKILQKEVEPPVPINVTLYQSLPKADKMETIIQKCTELGITKIVPFTSEYTVVNINNKKAEEGKLERWRKITLEACKQCGRSRVPTIDNIISFEDVLGRVNGHDLVVFAYEKQKQGGLKELLKNSSNIKDAAIIVGPEGGFSEKEAENAVQAGVQAITLGPRILRTETAGMAVLSIIMYELGDMGR